MVVSDLLVEQIQARAEWKYATLMHGALSVMTSGGLSMQEWSVHSLGLCGQVAMNVYFELAN